MSTPQLLADTTDTIDTAETTDEDDLATALVEDVSIDGMCGVY